jgi:peptide deformylase
MSTQEIRIIGDPVLQQRANDVADIDGALVRLVDNMFDSMYAAPGLGLAAPQIGVRKRIFVYDIDDDPQVLINPEIVESRGEWAYEEGCLSVPGLAWEIVRPKEIHLRGIDLDGNQVDIEADELLGRVFQHELDHLDGVLLVDHLTEDQRDEAKRALRELMIRGRPAPPAVDPLERGLRLR